MLRVEEKQTRTSPDARCAAVAGRAEDRGASARARPLYAGVDAAHGQRSATDGHHTRPVGARDCRLYIIAGDHSGEIKFPRPSDNKADEEK